jgi:hypothetical protein
MLPKALLTASGAGLRQVTASAALALIAGLWACGGDPPPPGAEAQQDARVFGASGNAAGSGVETLPWPSDPCAWIPVAAVESIVGPLAGPPRKEQGGCLFPLPLDAETIRRRAQAARMDSVAAKLAERLGEKFTPLEDRRPTEPAVIVEVDLTARTEGERALGGAEEVLASWVGETIDTAPNGRWARAGGWNFARSPISIGLPGFMGRAGQLSVSAMLQATPPVTDEMLARLAARVRDGVPDRPFRSSDPGASPSGSGSGGRDPCGVLTRAEAEAVLGPLTLSPYRTAESSPYPDPGGASCAYRTRAHRVLSVTPYWSDGESAADLARMGGRLLGTVVPGLSPEAADTIEGPWEEAVEDVSGSLLFRSGDRAVEIAYLTSSTGAAGAVRLARQAAARLFEDGR